jgi:hypothetical protein
LAGGIGENEYLDMPFQRELVVTNQQAALRVYKVRDGDTWSNIAARAYRGRSDLWWAIAEQSGVEDPFTELTVGKELNVQSHDQIMFEVLNFDPTFKGKPSDRSVT